VTTGIRAIRHGIATWFGGPYDEPMRSYRTPQVEGLGVVRRARAGLDDHAEYFLGQPAPGGLVGSQMLVHVQGATEERVAIAGPTSGLKLVRADVLLAVWLRSTAEHTEDAGDAFYGLLDRLLARLRDDRTCGTGGFEAGYDAGGFQIGEGGDPWLRWEMDAPETSNGLTSAYLTIAFQAKTYIQA